MSKKKKKLPVLISVVPCLGLLFLGFHIANLLDLPESYFCPERVELYAPTICTIPILGRVISGFSSPSYWLALIFFVITYGGFLYVMQKKGYDI